MTQEEERHEIRLETDEEQQYGGFGEEQTRIPRKICLKGAIPTKSIMADLGGDHYGGRIADVIEYAVNVESALGRAPTAMERAVADSVRAAMHNPSAQVDFIGVVYEGGDRARRTTLTSNQMRDQSIDQYLRREGLPGHEVDVFEVSVTEDDEVGLEYRV